MAGNLKAFLAEFIGTFALVFLAAGAVCVDALSGGRLGPVGIALAYGGATAMATAAYGRVSGAHFNPALTLALMSRERIPWIKGVFYVIAQLLGAALGGVVLKAVLHDYPQLSVSSPFLGCCAGSAGFKAATLIEALLSFFLATAFYSGREPEGGPSAAAVGVVVTVSVLFGFPLTGAALNPARAFGPSMATGHWPLWYVYWIGPLAGAFSATLLQEALFLEKSRPEVVQ